MTQIIRFDSHGSAYRRATESDYALGLSHPIGWPGYGGVEVDPTFRKSGETAWTACRHHPSCEWSTMDEWDQVEVYNLDLWRDIPPRRLND